jgi:hypothetical protein
MGTIAMRDKAIVSAELSEAWLPLNANSGFILLSTISLR